MVRHFLFAVAIVLGLGGTCLAKDEATRPRPSPLPKGEGTARHRPKGEEAKTTTQELAGWIDARFAEQYQESGEQPAPLVDDATFLRRLFLDLQGRIPTVAQVRDFMADQSTLKSLLPEQVFDSLEQALGLPVAKADNGPRFNGERAQFVARMNESAAETPIDYKGGIPQALMLMNGKLTADATNLESSRTLRAVVEAPFLSAEDKIETLFLAALTRRPTEEEREFLLDHVRQPPGEQERKQAYAQILWGLINSPEFVLSR